MPRRSRRGFRGEIQGTKRTPGSESASCQHRAPHSTRIAHTQSQRIIPERRQNFASKGGLRQRGAHAALSELTEHTPVLKARRNAVQRTWMLWRKSHFFVPWFRTDTSIDARRTSQNARNWGELLHLQNLRIHPRCIRRDQPADYQCHAVICLCSAKAFASLGNSTGSVLAVAA